MSKYWQLFSSLALVALMQSPAAAVPATVPYVGMLSHDGSGAPYNGSVTVTAALYADANATSLLWGPNSMGIVPVNQGILSFVLGGQGPLSLDSALLSTEV